MALKLRLHFLVYLFIEGKTYLKGRTILDLREDLIKGYDFDEMRKNLIKAGEVFIKKHFKEEKNLNVSYIDEKTEHPEYLVFEYFVKARKIQVIFRHVDKLSYWLSKFIPFLFR